MSKLGFTKLSAQHDMNARRGNNRTGKTDCCPTVVEKKILNYHMDIIEVLSHILVFRPALNDH